MKHPSGLTLPELMIVIVLAAIIVSVAMPNFQQGVDKKRADSAIETLRSISGCLREYRIAHGGADPAAGWMTELRTWGCLDPGQFPLGWAFSIDEGSGTVTGVYSRGGTEQRKVTLEGAGNINQTTRGIISDWARSGSDSGFGSTGGGGATKLFRKMYEMPAYDNEKVS